ncbi:MAG: HEAT repeat domain-containing protein [Calothrix sp. MO_167.B42]|nr:HEAT repeat domain-containing protein [Calothrix sp. MO_167.B42]
MTNGTNYQPPVDRLLSFGDCYGARNQWHDYIAKLGLNSQHIPDLMRMAVDDTLNGADSHSQEVWAPIHAWRALAQLGAKEAIEPLMKLFHEWEDNDWVAEEMPKVYGAISRRLEAGGMATSTASGDISNVVIGAMQNYLAEPSHGVFPRITSVNCLEEIGKQSENTRSQCIDVLTKQLKSFVQNPIEINGFIVASLIELQAIESASIIYSAFVRQVVPEDIVGSWDDVQQVLGVNADDLHLITDVVVESEVRATDAVTDDVTDTASDIADVVVESEITDDVVETVTATDTAPAEIADVPVESEITDDVVETVTQTSEEDVTPIPTTTMDATPEIAELPAVKSSTQKTEIEENKGFGTNITKKKSKASKKKKR